MSIAAGDLAAVATAVVLAALGGEAFLKGVVGVAGWLRVPKLLVATTLAAFATSSPELSVSTLAALAGKPEIGLGDALGSNVVNLCLILGLTLLHGPLRVEGGLLRRDVTLALVIPPLTLLLAADGTLSRLDGGLLLLIFAGWLTAAARQGLAARSEMSHVADDPGRPGTALLLAGGGLLVLLLAGRLFVKGAGGIALALGIDAYIIGATVVAVGTSLPELVTTVLARLRGHDDVGVGTLLGSNLFNGLGIVGLAASIHPIHAPFAEILVSIACGIVGVLLMVPRRGVISRDAGIGLLVVYVAFVATTLLVARVT